MLRKALSVALAAALGAVLLIAQPAHASYGSCTTPHNLSFGYIGNGISQTTGFALTPLTPGCDAPYEGRNNTCAMFQLVVLWSPVTHESNVFGPWVKSCDTPQKLASSFSGWVRQGDSVYVRAQGEQNGSHNPGGTLFN